MDRQPVVAEANETSDAPEIVRLMGDFAQAPDEEHFDKLLKRARDSDDPQLTALLDYNELSKEMQPVYDPKFDMAGLYTRLKKRDPADFRLLSCIMVIDTDPWRRWTMAATLGDYGGKQSLPKLRVLLNDPEVSVRDHAAEAIDKINGVVPRN